MRRSTPIAPVLTLLLALAPMARAQDPLDDVRAAATARLGATEAARLDTALSLPSGPGRARAARAALALLEAPGGATAPEVLATALAAGGVSVEVARARLGEDVAAALRQPRVAVALALLELSGPAPDAAAVRRARAALSGVRDVDSALARDLERRIDATASRVDPDLAVRVKVEESLALARAKLSVAEATRYAEAVALARFAHGGQVRDGGQPALLHALRVANALMSTPGVEPAAVHAAVLHDVLEDTKTPRSELRRRMGARVIELVDAVTLDPLERFGNDKAARDRAYYERFAGSPEGARWLKLYDRIDNINDMSGWPPEGQLGYLKRTRETVVEALRRHSPALAARLEAELTRLEARVRRDLAREAPRAAALDRLRRPDGTLRWGEAIRTHALTETTGLARFTLAMFLKELAVVLRTGDRLRIEELFDGLLSTDFFAQYGAFALGARAGEVAFSRSLERLVRPRFVAELLRSNVSLAAGLLASELAMGHFDGEAFAISLGALGLSSTAVRAGVAGLRWVRDLRRAGAVARAGGVAGFVYSVAETTVVLVVAEAIEERVRAWKDAREARAALVAAGRAFAADLRRARDAAAARAAAERYDAAWTAWRDHLLAPALLEDARLRERLERLARRSKLLQDERGAALAALARAPALLADVERRHGSVEAWSAARAAEDEAALRADLEAALAAHTRAVAGHLTHAYDAPRRGAPLLAGVARLPWLLGAAADPWGGRADLFARFSRGRAEGAFDAALGLASTNRLEAYDDEAAVLEAAADAIGGERADALREVAARARRARDLDARLARPDAPAPAPTRGLVDALEPR